MSQKILWKRVDRLIVRSTQATNRDNIHNYGIPPFQPNKRSHGANLNRPLRGHPQEDIGQNLRGPELNASGPFGKNDGSRPIQCFRCRGWGHPKRLCPSRLNYTWGEWYRNLPPKPMEGEPRTLLPPAQILNNRYKNITGGQKIS